MGFGRPTSGGPIGGIGLPAGLGMRLDDSSAEADWWKFRSAVVSIRWDRCESAEKDGKCDCQLTIFLAKTAFNNHIFRIDYTYVL
jgi:hypothetical protein